MTSYFEKRKNAIEIILNHCTEYLPEYESNVVDIGVGEGASTILLAKKGYAVTGMDIDLLNTVLKTAYEEAIKTGIVCNYEQKKYTPKSGEISLIKCDARTELKKIPDNSIDMVCSFYTGGPSGVTENPWKEIYNQANRILKPEHYFLITTEHVNSEPQFRKLLPETLDFFAGKLTSDVIADRYLLVLKKKKS